MSAAWDDENVKASKTYRLAVWYVAVSDALWLLREIFRWGTRKFRER